MVRYSNRTMKQNISDKLSDILFALLTRRNKKELSLIFSLFFTKAERMMFLKRIGIYYMLLRNHDRTTICEMLKVSSSTVAYYALQQETQKEELIVSLKSLLFTESIKGLFEDIIASMLIQPNLYGSHKKIQSKYEKIKGQKKSL